MSKPEEPPQPLPTKPAPLLDQTKKLEIWKLANIVGAGECSRLWDKLTYEEIYTPPTTKGEGVLTYPDSAGGVQWGGDPQKQIEIVSASYIVQYVKLYSRDDYENADNGSGNESSPAMLEGTPYVLRLIVANNGFGMPCWQPSFGEIVMLDMHTGDVEWRRPIDASQQYGFFMPESWGSPTIGGPAVTAGSVIFISTSMNAKVRAYSVESDEELWSNQAEAPAVANLSVNEYKGRQDMALAASGNTLLKDQVGDQVVVYALSEYAFIKK